MELEQQSAADVYGVSNTVSVLGRTISPKRAGNFGWLSPGLVAGNCEITPGRFVTGVYDGLNLTELYWRAGNNFVCGGNRFATWANDGLGVVDSILGSFPGAALGDISPEGDLVLIPNFNDWRNPILYRAGTFTPIEIPSGPLSFTRNGKGLVCMRDGVILWSEGGALRSYGAGRPVTGGLSILDPRFCTRSDGRRFILYIDGAGLSVIEWVTAGSARGWRVGPHTGHDFRPDIASGAEGLVIGSSKNEGEVLEDRQIYTLNPEEDRWKLGNGPWVPAETFVVRDDYVVAPLVAHVGAYWVTNPRSSGLESANAAGTFEVLDRAAQHEDQIGSRRILANLDSYQASPIPAEKLLGLTTAWREAGVTQEMVDASHDAAVALGVPHVLYDDAPEFSPEALAYCVAHGDIPAQRCYLEKIGQGPVEEVDVALARVIRNTERFRAAGLPCCTWIVGCYTQSDNLPLAQVVEMAKRLIALRAERYPTYVRILACFAYTRHSGILDHPEIRQVYDALALAVQGTPALPPARPRALAIRKAEITVDAWTLDEMKAGREFRFHDRINAGLGTRVRVWVEATPTGPSMRAEIDYPGAGTDLAGRTGAPRIVKVCPTT